MPFYEVLNLLGENMFSFLIVKKTHYFSHTLVHYIIIQLLSISSLVEIIVFDEAPPSEM